MTLRSFLKATCNSFSCILYGRRKNTWKKTRYCSSALGGALCAWLICTCIFKSFLISKKYENFILFAAISIAASGFVLTDAVKCITLLIFISLLGKSGRSYLRALSFAFVISGPIENLSSNTGEIIRTFSCSKILAINLTRTRFDLMIKPFQKTIIHMKEDISDVQTTFNELRNVTRDLHNEVIVASQEDRGVVYRNLHTVRQLNENYIENHYKNKFRRRCIEQLDNGRVRCREAFSSALKKCYNKIPFILKTLICWPFKVDFICNINVLGNPEKICDSSDVVPDNFGKTYVELVATENELYKKSSNIKVNYTILNSDTVQGMQSAQEIAQNVANEFENKKRIFDSVLGILQQFLGFMILKIMYDQLWHRSQEECQAVTFHFLQFSLEIVTGCFFLFLDYIVVSVLFIIRNNSEMAFVQEGDHMIQFQIQGSGLIARLLKNTMEYFNMHETVSTYLTNEACLPNPTVLPKSFYLKLVALYIFVLLLVYQSSGFLRMRRLICGYFYRKREKRRILYLYNSLLKERRTVRETMIKKAKYNFANRQVRLKANYCLIQNSSSVEMKHVRFPIAMNALMTSKILAGFVTMCYLQTLY